ncbi:MAG: carbon-monoxide dehydrogenase large subunit [Thermoplasmata archaeon]|jgi:carbon-monoxide dehydrogenase large subunit|nr:carbon-monoxide dehydrogenase large subunit [Thermoplasmata archaeon]
MATAPLGGIGVSVPRKEDARFIRGKGNYVDDVQLPGMLFLDIVRSPYAYAKILAIHKEKTLAVPGVLAVITGKDLEAAKLSWMPTLMSDTQMVLPTDTVMFQGQEVVGVVATDRYAAADGVAAMEIDYEPMTPVIDPFKALDPGAPVLRTDKPGRKDNHIWHWEVGDKDGTAQALKESDVVIKEKIYIPRIHVSSIETCGCVAQVDSMGKLTVWLTTQAPHAIRTVFALVSGLPENQIRIISPDIGGGFGGKVPVYPGYVIAVVAALTTGHPVKFIEDRTGNLTSDSFARDYHIEAEIGATKDGRLTALRVKTLADHGYTDAAANPSKFPAGMFHVITGSYPFKKAFVEVDAVYTNKPPGGIAYRCSFRVTEAVHAIERLIDILAHQLKMDPAEFRLKNFIPPEAFPFPSVLGWTYDSGNYAGALKKAMEIIDYAGLRKEQVEKRKRGELMGIGISSFTEIVGAGPSKDFDILGIKMFDSAEVRIHPTGKVLARFGTKSQGQGHETTYAQILAEELGIPVEGISVEEGDTDTAPYGLGTYASRSTPTAGAAAVIAARKIREKGAKIAAHLLEVSPDDIEWVDHKFQVKGVPGKSKTMADVAFAAYTNHPQGMEAGLEAVDYYDPPNMTYPFGSYIAVVDIDKETGQIKTRRFVAVDDCGTIINPMIVDGQIHGGLTMGFAPSMLEEIQYDADGNNKATSFLEYLLPTAVETPHWETAKTTTPSPHHPIGAKGVGESATVGAPPAFVNAVVDALEPYGVTNIDIPLSSYKIWQAIHSKDPP